MQKERVHTSSVLASSQGGLNAATKCTATKYVHMAVANAVKSTAWVAVAVFPGCASLRRSTRNKSRKHATASTSATSWALKAGLDRARAAGAHHVPSSGPATPRCRQWPSLPLSLLLSLLLSGGTRQGQPPSCKGPHSWHAALAPKPSATLTNWGVVDQTSSRHEGQSSAFMSTVKRKIVDIHSANRAA